MFNAMLISFGDGMMMGRIAWPVDGMFLAVGMVAAFLILLGVLLRESTPVDSAIHNKPKGVRPLPRPVHISHAA